MKKPGTSIGKDRVRPTAHQIRANLFVLPLIFYRMHFDELDWNNFRVVALGEVFVAQHLDQNRRVHVRLSGKLSEGDVLTLRVEDSSLIVTPATECASPID